MTDEKTLKYETFTCYSYGMSFFKRDAKKYILIYAGIMLVFASVLFFMGQVPICRCGYIKLWQGVVFSSENSQHISDWYTFSHLIHGFIFYWVLSVVGKKKNMSFGLRLLIALIIEVSWELFENTDFIINRYREATISLDYYGDSIINSVADVFSMIVGFALAYRLPVRVTIFVAVALEVFVGLSIRDNLMLNIIMLLYPMESIKQWQMGI